MSSNGIMVIMWGENVTPDSKPSPA